MKSLGFPVFPGGGGAGSGITNSYRPPLPKQESWEKNSPELKEASNRSLKIWCLRQLSLIRDPRGLGPVYSAMH